MKAYRVVLFALLFVLAACSQAPTPTPTPEETLLGQAVLPGASGIVFYIVHGKLQPDRIFSYDQATDVKTEIYSSEREIQSVAGTLTGSTVIVSMQETESATSDFEIFEITNGVATQLTTNTTDDIHVSISRGSILAGVPTYRMAWETQVSCGIACSKRGIQIQSRSAFGITDSFVSAGSGDLTRPSMSGNGRHIAFVRKSGITQSVELYERTTQTFSIIASSGNNLPITSYFDPSSSDDGTKVAYLSRTLSGLNMSYSIRLYDKTTNTTTNVISGRVFYPHLTADGQWLTYVRYRDESSHIQTRNLVTNLEAKAATASYFTVVNKPFWQKANP